MPTPTVAAVEITTLPYDARGYAVRETIGVQVTFNEPVELSGTPILRLGIGANTREAEWAQEGTAGPFVTFSYRVTLDDRDEDGVSIGADALDLAAGTIANASDLAADIHIGDHAIVNDEDHLVLGRPPQMPCREQRALALRETRETLAGEWTGTPFPVHLVRNFPDHVPERYLEGQLDVIGRVADQIDEQLGYRILERGELIEVPRGLPRGWDQTFEGYSVLRGQPGEIWLFYLNEDHPAGGTMSSHPCCGTVSYNWSYFAAPHWPDEPGPRGPHGDKVLHVLFVLLGFKPYYYAQGWTGVAMSAGALDRPSVTGASTHYVTWTDIENLRCMFPQVG